MIDSSLPDSWAKTHLGDVVDYGYTAKIEPQQINDDDWVLELEDIEKDTSRVLSRLTYGERQSKSTKNQFAEGDVLYGKLRPYLNKVVIADRPGCSTTEIIPLKPGEHLDNRYLFYWLKNSLFLDYVTEVSHGLNMPRLGTQAGRSAPFVLAPREEQKRITDKLDALLARVDACREGLDRIPALLKRFRQSVLAAATTGSLSENWTGRTDEPWQPILFQDLLADEVGAIRRGPFGSSIKKSFFVRDGYKVYEQRNAIQDDANLGAYFLSEEKYRELEGFSVRSGDFIVSCAGTIGRISRLPEGAKPGVINQALMRIRISEDKALPAYFMHAFKSPDFQSRILEQTQGSAMQNMAAVKVIKSVPLRWPRLDEQAEILRRVDALFALADRIEARYQAARARVDRLAPALLAKAFRGELAPQDPADEPASVLLERIRAERAAAPAKPKRGRKARESA